VVSQPAAPSSERRRMPPSERSAASGPDPQADGKIQERMYPRARSSERPAVSAVGLSLGRSRVWTAAFACWLCSTASPAGVWYPSGTSAPSGENDEGRPCERPPGSRSAGVRRPCERCALVGLDSGGGIRTRDLRVMSPTSYLTAPPRVGGLTNVALLSGAVKPSRRPRGQLRGLPHSRDCHPHRSRGATKRPPRLERPPAPHRAAQGGRPSTPARPARSPRL
jgi:hypothetical protein